VPYKQKETMSVADSENTSNQEQQQPVTQNGETPVAADDVGVATLAAPSVACSENKDVIQSSVTPAEDSKPEVIASTSTNTTTTTTMDTNCSAVAPASDDVVVKKSDSDDDDNAKGDDDEDDTSVKSEGADEEDALFTTLEIKEEQEEMAHPHEQPSDAKAAPMLLQSALAKGDVKMDDSGNEEKKVESVDEVVHQRVSGEHTYHLQYIYLYLYLYLYLFTSYFTFTFITHSFIIDNLNIRFRLSFLSIFNFTCIINRKINLISCFLKPPNIVPLFQLILNNYKTIWPKEHKKKWISQENAKRKIQKVVNQRRKRRVTAVRH
jgi:hypothetical protein